MNQDTQDNSRDLRLKGSHRQVSPSIVDALLALMRQPLPGPLEEKV